MKIQKGRTTGLDTGDYRQLVNGLQKLARLGRSEPFVKMCSGLVC